MGFSSYFKAKKPEPKKPAPKPQPTGDAIFSEKRSSNPTGQSGFELQVPTPNFGSSRNSLSGASGSMFLDDIKHEVMVNYLYQQQCSHLWVADGSGEVEGVLLRKARGNYMACPPRLANSAFAMACATLNVQVCCSGYSSRVTFQLTLR
ncbi:hypothetical protein O1611_g8738 [Lasiodiplodia mahajangana]|uniref:Uncharacterized protein n=1 Tax=Lasiodiplodia mahajangana TaxID=1108764 RepID=A0ACC2JC84_9PEZI|nr:hypothetical protein O1611_g8738 [Lasiodiplodia mahajangana]